MSLMLLISTAVIMEIATPAMKIPKCSHLTLPEAKTVAAAPAGGWIMPNFAIPGMTMAGARAERNHGSTFGM